MYKRMATQIIAQAAAGQRAMAKMMRLWFASGE
jgi:hypothetical protein